MANLITLLRFLLLFLLVAMAYWAPPAWQLLNAPLLLVIIALDAVDGWVARRRGETSVFGSVFDIAVDRVVENVLWIVLSNLGLIPIWVAIVFIVRGLIVDSIRYAAMGEGGMALDTVRGPLARMLVAGRWMRGGYGALKATTFAWVLLLQPLAQLFPQRWAQWSSQLQAVSSVLVLATVGMCLVRGLPVIVEFVVGQKVFTVRPHLSAGSR
ncbi:MAG: CDP-alcohol phosphatidyltransferase family protein [Rhodospirillales bacterium]